MKFIIGLIKNMAILAFLHISGLCFFYFTDCVNTENDLLAYGISAGLMFGVAQGMKESLNMKREI